MANQVLSVEIDKKTLDEVKFMLSTVRYGVNDALRIGANKTAETAQSRVVKSLASDLTLTQKKIKADTELVRAYYENLSSKVIVKSKPIPIIDFKTGAQLKSGINIEVRRGKKVKYAHRFIAEMSSGHIGIFNRKKYADSRKKRGRPTTSGYVGRLEIEEKFGPSTALVFHYNGEDEVMKEMSELYPKKLLEQAIYLLNKAT